MSDYVKFFGTDDLNKAEAVSPSTKFEFGDFVFGQLAYDDKVPVFDPAPNQDNTFTGSVGFVKEGEIVTIAFPLLGGMAVMGAMYFDGYYELQDTGGNKPSGKVITVPRYKTCLINPKFNRMPYAYILKRISAKSIPRENEETK